MQSLENLVGQLQLTLHYTRDAGLCRVNAVHLHSNRLCLNAHFLTGKSVELAPKLTGMLFSLATWAHMVSCLDSSPPVPVTVVAIGGLERMAQAARISVALCLLRCRRRLRAQSRTQP